MYVVPVSPGGFEQVHHSHCSVLCTSFVFSVYVPCNIYWHFDDGVLSREIAWAICCDRPFEKRAGYFCITLTLEPGRKVEAAQRDFTAKDRVFLTNEVPREGGVRRVNLSAMWTKSTDAMLIEAMEALDDDDVYAPSETSSVAGSDNSAYSGGSAEDDQEGMEVEVGR